MRNMIAIALGFLLLVSAAAAAGNNNIAGVDVTEIIAGQVITGADFGQLADVDANIAGNTNIEIQGMNLSAAGNILTGLSNGKTFLLQSGDMMLADTGNGNVDWQFELLSANTNQVAIGNITQAAVQVDENKGNSNNVFQLTAQDAGTVSGFQSTVAAGTGIVAIAIAPFGAAVPSPNILTNSELKQLSGLDAFITGNTNTAQQWGMQGAFDNTMTDSKLWQQNSVNADVLGNSNSGSAPQIPLGGASAIATVNLPLPFGFSNMQTSAQLADDNTMTKSLVNQLICQNEDIVGNTNIVGQTGVEGMTLDILTNSGVLQKINEDIISQGNSNAVSQNAALTSTGNVVTGGNIIQQSDVDTNS